MAGEYWLSGFLKQHQNLAIRKSEATSLARATNFNPINVKNFFLTIEKCNGRIPFSVPKHLEYE